MRQKRAILTRRPRLLKVFSWIARVLGPIALGILFLYPKSSGPTPGCEDPLRFRGGLGAMVLARLSQWPLEYEDRDPE